MKGNKSKYNKYEKSLMFNVELMKIIFYVLAALNLLLPLFQPISLGITSAFQWFIIAAHAYGLAHGLGVFEGQKTPIIQVGLLRIVEVAWYRYISGSHINWLIFVVLLFVDVLFVAVLLLDKNTYAYEKVSKEPNALDK
jgi:hypothetical protein